MKEILNLISGSRKAIVPIAVGAVLWVLAQVGITGDITVKEAVTLGVTGVVVWLTRNR